MDPPARIIIYPGRQLFVLGTKPSMGEPLPRMTALVIAALVVVSGYHVWVYATAHWSRETSLDRACRYFSSCEVCVNMAGAPVCGAASYVDRELALKVAWFRACERALGGTDAPRRLGELATRERLRDACDTEMGSVFIEPGHGFFTITEAERACVAHNAAAFRTEVDRMLKGTDSWVNESRQRIERDVGSYLAAEEEIRKVKSALWKTCVATLQRYSAKCESASETRHFESAGREVPPEVLRFGL